MKVTPAQVRQVAHLARLRLSEEELAIFTDQLDSILTYMEELDVLNTEGVPPTSHAVPMSCPMREDEERPSAPREGILSRSPRHDAEFFIVPKIID